MKRALEQMGVTRTARTLPKLNQVDGFDCQGCAWPDPDPSHRHTAEFCENGAKAVAEEATRRALDRDVLRRAPVAELREQHRLLARPAGPDHRADGAARRAAPTTSRSAGTTPSRLVAGTCAPWARPTRRSSTPRAGPPTRRRSSTSCSPGPSAPTTCPTARTCATSRRRSALAETIGIGKGTVSLEDVHDAELIVVVGQNPGTNHPRMLTRAGEGQAERREDRRDQPAARGGPGPVQEPADAARRGRPRHRPRRPAPAGPGQRRPRAVPGDRRAAARVGLPSTTTSSTATPPASRSGPSTLARRSTGTRSTAPPA